jgi:DNA polymerase-3 subunit beta
VPMSVPRAELASALTWASRSLPSRPLNPVLAGVRLNAKNGVLLVSAFDLDQSSSASVSIGEEELDVIVSGRLLVDIVKTLSGQDVILEEKKTTLQVTCGRSTFSLVKMPPETYPALPTVPPKFGSVDGQVFADATHKVCFAASSDTTTPVLTTVMVEANPEKALLTFAATDKFCLATTAIPYEPAEDAGSEPTVFLVPARVLEAYGKNLARESTVGLHANADSEGIFGVSGGDENSTTRVYAGEYPKYAPLINGTFTLEVAVDPSAVLEAVKRVSLMAESGQGIRLAFSEGALEVATLSQGGGSSPAASEVIDVDYTDEEIELVFNPQYLTSGLAHFDAGSVRMQMTAAGRPVKFTSGAADDPFVFLAMPLRV